ncbi:mitochondrial 30S ribosomal protein S13 [Cristinia sonorae]|uniref:Mitochondrial 30S ribosomal protein S13 n=1 Tax=Cristinia sonorae TaxID=1940300 RepID=A0A8K0UXL0_9AGAR|nr:mitochondrial 30S ribosomal protein S13 [Cristinia sonorae]
MHILGKLLRDNLYVPYALTFFYGIGPATAQRICARYQIHDRCKIRHLTPVQVTALTAFLSAPSNTPDAPVQPVAPPRVNTLRAKPFAMSSLAVKKEKDAQEKSKDPLQELRIESDLRREIRENIAHQRMIGSYVGRRHAMGLPVRGQSTRHNSKTARKLNRVERRN